jgi:hypothetical protein
MQAKVLANLVAVLLLAGAAEATPIMTINGGTSAVDLTPGNQVTIVIGITPDAAEVSGFNLFFDISDTASISRISCTRLVADQIDCTTPTPFNVLASFNTNQTSAFDVLSFVVDIPLGAAPGTTITLRDQSNIDDGNLTSIFLSTQLVARVVPLPEPATAGLLTLGLGALAMFGRKRVA